MIFHKPFQMFIHTFMEMTLAFFYKHKDVAEIENVFNKEFANVYEWSADNKVWIHFGEDRTEWILFSRKNTCQSLT